MRQNTGYKLENLVEIVSDEYMNLNKLALTDEEKALLRLALEEE